MSFTIYAQGTRIQTTDINIDEVIEALETLEAHSGDVIRRDADGDRVFIIEGNHGLLHYVTELHDGTRLAHTMRCEVGAPFQPAVDAIVQEHGLDPVCLFISVAPWAQDARGGHTVPSDSIERTLPWR